MYENLIVKRMCCHTNIMNVFSGHSIYDQEFQSISIVDR